MAFSRIEITFSSIPAVNDFLEFNEGLTNIDIKETFKVNRVAIKQCKIPPGVDAGEEGSPFIIYSGWITENYKTAFNLDYNTTGDYTVTTVNDAAGTGTGKVIVTANFNAAVFTEINTPAGASVEIFNEPFVETILIDEIVASESGEPCDTVLVDVTTNLLATKVLSPVVIDPNAANPFQLEVNRGATVTITVKDADDNEFSQDYTAPPLLEAGAFTVEVENDLAGAAVTVVGSTPGLELEYALEGPGFQESNVFTGVPPGVYAVIVRDQYGCTKSLPFTVEELPTDLFLSRSPFFITAQAPGLNFDSASLELRVWAGDIITDRPAAPTQQFSKIAVQAGQQKISFDIHHVVNDFVKNWLSYFVQSQGAFTVSSRDTVYVETITTATYLGETVGTDERRFLAVDGFGWHSQGANPPITEKVLSSITKHFFYGDNCPLYFITKGLTLITVNGVEVPFTFSQSTSNQVVAYINAAAYVTGSDPFTAVFVYGAETITHTFQKLTECKYAVAMCWFKNKFGFWQTIPFAKLSKKGVDVTDSNYESIILDYDQYDPSQHVTKSYGIEFGEKIVVNTDHLPETYNTLFRELMASEFIYLHQRSELIPVNRARNNWDEKTKTNNKLIQYSMEFKYSFNGINQVQ